MDVESGMCLWDEEGEGALWAPCMLDLVPILAGPGLLYVVPAPAGPGAVLHVAHAPNQLERVPYATRFNPVRMVTTHAAQLEQGPQALDLACGRGGRAQSSLQGWLCTVHPACGLVPGHTSSPEGQMSFTLMPTPCVSALYGRAEFGLSLFLTLVSLLRYAPLFPQPKPPKQTS